MAMIGLFSDTHENAESIGKDIILRKRELYVDRCTRDNGDTYYEIHQGDDEHTLLESPVIFSQKDYEDALAETKANMKIVTEFSQNMVNATSAANTSANDAAKAATEASAAAKACEGALDGMNTMVDSVTGVSCVIGVENGIIVLKEA
jgi:hypothetical protein